jgi:hypothetical protein
MTLTQERLAAIGFGGTRREPSCWRTVRISTPEANRRELGPEPFSPLLLSWRRILRREARPSPYRIARVER